MRELERAQALKALQLELFQLKQEYLLKRRDLQRQLTLIHGKGLKRCRKCRNEMDVEHFYPDKRYSDGYYPYCRECQVEKVSRKNECGARGVAA